MKKVKQYRFQGILTSVYIDGKWTIVKHCSRCLERLPLDKFHKSKSGLAGVRSYCKACAAKENAVNNAIHNKRRTPEYIAADYHNRRAKKAGTPADLTPVQVLEIKAEGRCMLTGETSDLSFDHWIPISRGGGSILGNIVLLSRKVNRAKNSHNPYVFLAERAEEFGITQEAIDKVTARLAELNGMTPVEYIEYVCAHFVEESEVSA